MTIYLQYIVDVYIAKRIHSLAAFIIKLYLWSCYRIIIMHTSLWAF